MSMDLKDIEVINANGLVLGRLSTAIAKMLLSGKRIAVINAEKIIITGDRKVITNRYYVRRNLLEKENPEHSPKWSRRPDFLVKRIVRGMLPYKKPRGKTAYKGLYVFIGIPDELKKVKPIDIKVKSIKDIYTKYVTISEVSKSLGYKTG